MIRSLFVIGAFLILLSACQLSDSSTIQNQSTVFPAALKDVDETAGLAIVINGIQLNLAKDIYTHKSEKIYLDTKFPGIVRIKKAPLTWNELFLTTPFKVENNCLTIDTRSTYCPTSDKDLKIFLNHNRIFSLNNQPISDGDALLISYGKETGVEIERQFSLLPVLP